MIFVDIPTENKLTLGIIFLIILFLLYFGIWFKSNNLSEINLDVEGSIVTVKAGDLFRQDGFKVIAFNEYFDTQVDDVIISHNSLNGLYIDNYLADPYLIWTIVFQIISLKKMNCLRSTIKEKWVKHKNIR
nr:macro domain-containing protein [Escherichia coli]